MSQMIPMAAAATPVSLPVGVSATDPSMDAVMQAFSHHQAVLGSGLAIAAGLAVVNRMGWLSKVPGKFLPWVSLAIGVLSGIAINLEHGQPWQAAAIHGAMSGLVATGAWELVLQHIPGLKKSV